MRHRSFQLRSGVPRRSRRPPRDPPASQKGANTTNGHGRSRGRSRTERGHGPGAPVVAGVAAAVASRRSPARTPELPGVRRPAPAPLQRRTDGWPIMTARSRRAINSPGAGRREALHAFCLFWRWHSALRLGGPSGRSRWRAAQDCPGVALASERLLSAIRTQSDRVQRQHNTTRRGGSQLGRARLRTVALRRVYAGRVAPPGVGRRQSHRRGAGAGGHHEAARRSPRSRPASADPRTPAFLGRTRSRSRSMRRTGSLV